MSLDPSELDPNDVLRAVRFFQSIWRLRPAFRIQPDIPACNARILERQDGSKKRISVHPRKDGRTVITPID
jgi:hypothetical protein